MSSNGLSYPVWYHKGSQRASQEMHVYSQYETVSLPYFTKYCFFYKAHLKAGNISTALNYALGKNQHRPELSPPSGELESPTLNPISGSAVLSHCGG